MTGISLYKENITTEQKAKSWLRNPLFACEIKSNQTHCFFFSLSYNYDINIFINENKNSIVKKQMKRPLVRPRRRWKD
jgi:hypothetical protein